MIKLNIRFAIYFVLIFLLTTVSLLNLSNVMSVAAQPNLLFPWDKDSGDWYMTNGGWHESGYDDGLWALDLGTSSSDNRILSSGSGKILTVHKCDLTANIKIDHGAGVVFNYVHIDLTTLDSKITVGADVNQGQFIGKLKQGNFGPDRDCGIAEQEPNYGHVHLIISTGAPITIDGWTIDSNNCMTKGSEQKCLVGTTMLLPKSSNSELSKVPECVPLRESDWVVKTDCKITEAYSTSQNIRIQDGATVYITSTGKLNFNFNVAKLEVDADSRLLIFEGGKLFYERPVYL